MTGREILLISKSAIDRRRYHETCVDVTWEDCDLRKWLNSEFLNQAFNEKEQKLIAKIDNSVEGNPTEDKVFLLSTSEVEEYFESDEDRKTIPTEYAKKNGAFASREKKNMSSCTWWLRTTGRVSNRAAFIHVDGSIIKNGYDVDNDDVAVRPALWLSID